MTKAMLLGMVAVAGCASAAAAPAPATASWSPTVDGVHGRLIAMPAADTAGRPQLRLELELENLRDVDAPLPIAWSNPGAMLQFTLEDEAGHAIAGSAVGGSYASGPPFAVQIPVSSTLRTLISATAYEYVSPTHTMLRPVTFQAWDMPAKHGTLYLRARFTPSSDKVAGPKAWAGPLELPRIPLP